MWPRKFAGCERVLRQGFFLGTLAPFFLASERPIAMACLRLVTFFPLRPLLSLPRFISCISVFTSLPALGLYFRLEDFLVLFPVDFFPDDLLLLFLVAINPSPCF
jgi:hypothetical protein